MEQQFIFIHCILSKLIRPTPDRFLFVLPYQLPSSLSLQPWRYLHMAGLPKFLTCWLENVLLTQNNVHFLSASLIKWNKKGWLVCIEWTSSRWSVSNWCSAILEKGKKKRRKLKKERFFLKREMLVSNCWMLWPPVSPGWPSNFLTGGHCNPLLKFLLGTLYST